MVTENQHLISIVEKYSEEIDALHGVYLDGTRGFDFLMKEAEYYVQKNQGLSNREKHYRQYRHIWKDAPSETVAHECSFEDLYHRNHSSGQNWMYIANMWLVYVYQLWEDNFRAKIGKLLGLQKDELKSDIMGDIRLIRVSIIHNGGKFKYPKSKFRILDLFDMGDDVFIDPEKLLVIKGHIRDFLRGILTNGSTE